MSKSHEKKPKKARRHECHWPLCVTEVPPAMWGCHLHWFTLPTVLRRRLRLAYRPGQEKDMRPSTEYLAVAKEVQQWIIQFMRSEAMP